MQVDSSYVIGNRKIAIIGAGYVGSSIAYALALQNVAREIVIINRTKDKLIGEVKDIRHGISGLGTADVYAGDYCDCADCDLIIISAGRNRKPGETRLDLMRDNVLILQDIAEKIKQYYTRGIILVISNPVDVLTQKMTEWMGLPEGRVFGSGNLLDSSRLVRTIADYLGISTGVINAYMVGEHGDAQVPIWSHATVAGIPISEYCDSLNICWDERIRGEIAEKTRQMGAEIIASKGRTHFGIATCVCYLADAIVNQRPTIVSVTSVLPEEFGCGRIALSVPSVVGPAGIQQHIRETWSFDENRAFRLAAEKVRGTLNQIPED